MGKKLRFWTGAALGAVLQYLYDPKAGPSRRALLRDHFTDWALDTRDGVVGKKLALGPFRTPERWPTSVAAAVALFNSPRPPYQSTQPMGQGVG